MSMVDFARYSLGLERSSPVDLVSLEVRGSERNFFRCTYGNGNSAILVHYDPTRIENTYYADISLFLESIGVPVPKLIRHDRAHSLILMEDMGNQSLWSFRDAPWVKRSELYRKTLASVHRLHSVAEKDFPAARVRIMESFGPDLYLWERNYFKEHFVKGFCHINLEPSAERNLEIELTSLAGRFADTERSLIHRDLQSQNVMIYNDEPYFIDFQGMRFGSLFYDLGSLLSDPYIDFTDEEVNELLSYYYSLSVRNHDLPTFTIIFWEASAQRLMQALGAYGFLGLTKGLTDFLAHIPSGLRNLFRATSHATSLPMLGDLSQMCMKAIKKK